MRRKIIFLMCLVFISCSTGARAKENEHNLAEGDNPNLNEVSLQNKNKTGNGTTAGPAAGQAEGWNSYTKLVEGLVKEYFAKAKIKKENNHLHVEFKSRPYDIPSLNKVEQGPDWGGIIFDMDLKDGQYTGVHAVPKKFNEYSFYHVMLYAPYSKKLDKHLQVRIAYPFDVPPEFLKRLTALVENFDTHF